MQEVMRLVTPQEPSKTQGVMSSSKKVDDLVEGLPTADILNLFLHEPD
jgi:hypothetical protein